MQLPRKFKLTIEYDGAEFSGWQTQAPGFRTVQSHIEEKLKHIFKTTVHCLASSRTDRGVHAVGQVAHITVQTSLTEEIIDKALNTLLDRDVSIISVKEVPLKFSAQDSKRKTYRYTILNRPSPSALWRSRAYYYPGKLDMALMRRAARDIIGQHDFKAFQNASQRSPTQTTIRHVKRLTIIRQGDMIHITITADGFLYKMVRNIVSALIAVGSGSIPCDSIPRILKKKDRVLNKLITAPSHGLCLLSVKY